VSGKSGRWILLADLASRARRIVRRSGARRIRLKQLLADVWDGLEATTTCLRLVVSKQEDADQLQTLEYLKIDRSAGLAKILVRGRIADGLGFEDKDGWYTIFEQDHLAVIECRDSAVRSGVEADDHVDELSGSKRFGVSYAG
jgi:hypothetical protein